MAVVCLINTEVDGWMTISGTEIELGLRCQKPISKWEFNLDTKVKLPD